ncbi:MAG: bifunctional sugar-1-phosphate nucleotidylyltransferase/acetyltransferase [Candidatus Bathyarchaeia archaeon]
MKAVVLAAGEGIRLRPLTLTRPKHLIPIASKPFLEYLFDSIKAAEINEVLVVVYYMADRIQQRFGDGSRLGMRLEYAFQGGVRGTADAAGVAEPYVQGDFLLIYGDLLVSPDVIKQVLGFHKREKPTATMAVTPVEQPERYGVVKLEDSHLIEIVEKPRPGEAPTNLANAGIYVLSTEVFEKIRQTERSVRGEWEITDSLTLLAQEGRRVLAVQIPSEQWLDVGRPWDLLEANRRILDRMEFKVEGEIEEGARVTGSVMMAEGSRIRSGAHVEGPTFIDKGSDIGPNCFIGPYTSIGKDVEIGNNCKIQDCMILDKTRIGHLSSIEDSIVGENCRFGAKTVVANYHPDGRTIRMTVKGEVVDTGRKRLGAVFGDRISVGADTLFMPGVKIGYNSRIGSGVIVHRDVPSNTSFPSKQESVRRNAPE